MTTTKILVSISLLCILFSLFAVTVSADDYYIVNKTNGKFHLPTCSYLPDSSNRYTIQRDEIENYPKLSPCGHCDPLNNYVYEPENPGQSSGGSSSSSSGNSSKNSSKETWLERKENEGTPLLDMLAGVFIFFVIWFSGGFFIETIDEEKSYRYKLFWPGRILLALLCILSIFILIGICSTDGSGIIKLFLNAIYLPILFAILFVLSLIWVFINQDKLL